MNVKLSNKFSLCLKKFKLLIIKYNKENSWISALLKDLLSLIIFFVVLKEATCLIAYFFPLVKFGVSSSNDLDKSTLNIDNIYLSKINKFASIKHISENVKKDDLKLIEIFEEMKKDLNNISIDKQISDLESKFSQDLSENTFNKIIELKKLQNTN